MGRVHVIASRYGGAIQSVVPEESVSSEHHERFLHHLGDAHGRGHHSEHYSSTAFDADELPFDPATTDLHGLVLRDGAITASGHVAASAAIATAAAANALIGRQQKIIEGLAARMAELEKRLAAPPSPRGGAD